MAESIPYRFSYDACDADGVKKWVLVEDRELFSLFLKCRNISGNERVAIKKVREKYLDAFSHRDIYFFMGTRMKDQMLHHARPYSIIGVFYPPRDDQYRLF